MDKESIDAILKEYESDKANKGFCTIITNDGKRYGQTPKFCEPLSKFEMFNDKLLIIEFNEQVCYIAIESISMICLRPQLFPRFNN